MKTKLSLLLYINSLFAVTYTLSQKPFLEDLNVSDNFARGTFLIILADENLKESLTSDFGDFIHFKNTQGYNVEVWDYSNIGSGIVLRDSLKSYYETNKMLEYVLLVGDYDPDSQITNPVIDSFTISSYNEAQLDVTDHPYTYFEGDPTTDDGLNPKYFIGRWSISSEQELKIIAAKTIQYIKREYVQDSNYLDRALLVAGSYKTEGANSVETFPHNWPVSPVWTSVWLKDRLNQYGYSKVDTAFFYKDYMSTTIPTIANSWNEGVGIINYRGWGNAQGWVKPQFFISPDVVGLTPTFDLPVVFSFVCNTGDFGNDIEPSFGEALLRGGSIMQGGSGAVAMVGPSDLDTDTRFNNVLCGALWDGLLEHRTPELAQALHVAKQAVAKEFHGISETGACAGCSTQDIPVFYHHVYGVLGDPSLPIWLKNPNDLQVYNPDGLLLNQYLDITDRHISLQLKDEEGEVLEDVIGALMFNDSLIAKGISTYDGYLDIDFSNALTIEVDSELELYLNKPQFSQLKINLKLTEIQETIFTSYPYNLEIVDDNSKYNVQEVEYNWIELNPEKGGQGINLNLRDDTIIDNVELGFDFTYFGYSYDKINICSNGWVAFERARIPYFWNFSIPFPMGPSAMLAVFFDDLDDNGRENYIDTNGNNIYDHEDEFISNCGTPDNPINPYDCHDYNQNGVYDSGEPFNVFKWQDEVNNRFIVQWDEISNAEDDENCNTLSGCVKETFQLILYNPEYQNSYGQGNIVFQYKEIHDIDDGRIGKNGNLSTIGIESPDQNHGFQYLFRGALYNGAQLVDGGLNEKAIQFSSNQIFQAIPGTYLNVSTIDNLPTYMLIESYPNPFNPIANIKYILTEYNYIDMSVYDITGREIASLYRGNQFPGTYQLQWNANQFSSGVYFISLINGNKKITHKVLLMK